MSEERDPNPNRIRVFLRVRPNNREEGGWFRSGQFRPILRDEHMTPNPDRSIVIDRSGKRYDFDRVFRQEATQRHLFQYAALPTLENVFNGYCGAVLAYGQTGTGKTHTMQGYERDPQGEQRGIIPRSAEYVFHRISRSPDLRFVVRVSFVQIYLDKLQDLFKPEAPEVSINPETERVELPGITQVEVKSPEELMRHFYWGERHRVTRATKMNETSSRGHAALIVNLEMTPRDNDGSQATRFGKLVLVDLAGYERFTQTGVTSGIAAEEAKKINASLLALGSVVNALAEACSKRGPPQAHHIPYRNAKLTRLLKDCLGGTSVTAIICTVGPCDKYSQETSGTLYFGWRAMAVKVDAKVKEIFDPVKYTQILRAKLQAAHERIHSLVAWWSRSNPKDYAKYVQKYGEPEFMPGLAETDDYEAQIMEALGRAQAAAPAPAAAHLAVAAAASSEAADEEEEGKDLPAAVRQVQRDWRRELDHLSDQARAEEELLRLRHLQDMEEARAAGVSEEMLHNLRREHSEELSLMREQNRLLKHEIVRQKQKEEVKALLLSAKEANDVSTGRPTAADALAEQRQQEFHRIAEIVEHLQQTCDTKDEVLNRMFELICYYEATINDYDVNVVAIAAAHGGAADADRQLAEARKREEELRTLVFLQNEELEALRKAAAAAPPPSSPRALAGGLDALWLRAMAAPPSAASTELEVQAVALREQLRDVLARMEAPPPPQVLPGSVARPASIGGRPDLLATSAPAPPIGGSSVTGLPSMAGSASIASAYAPHPALGPIGASSSLSAGALSSLQRLPPGSALMYDVPASLGSPPGPSALPPGAAYATTPVTRLATPGLAPTSPLQAAAYYPRAASDFAPAGLDSPSPPLSSSGTYRFGSSGSLGRTSSGATLYSGGGVLQPATIPPVTSYVPGYPSRS